MTSNNIIYADLNGANRNTLIKELWSGQGNKQEATLRKLIDNSKHEDHVLVLREEVLAGNSFLRALKKD